MATNAVFLESSIAQTQQSQELALLGGLHLFATCGLDIGPFGSQRMDTCHGYQLALEGNPDSWGGHVPSSSYGEWRRLLAWPLPLRASLCSHRGLFSSKPQHRAWGRSFQAV